MPYSIQDNFQPMPKLYGVFPYIAVKIFSATYVQIPLIICNAKFSKYIQENSGNLPNHAYVGSEMEEEQVNRRAYLADPDNRKSLIWYMQQMAKNMHYKQCFLVLSETDAVYYNEGEIKETNFPPNGGVLYNKQLVPLKIDRNHFKDIQPEFIDLSGKEVLEDN